MSEQYRCSECGHFVEIQDDAICDVCNIGKMQHLRYIRGSDGSHWEGCADVHWDCRIAQLEAELARRDEIIARLKEDGEKLSEHLILDSKGYFPHIQEQIRLDILAHRALMKELE